MADLFFRAEVWRVGHGVEGPWQHFNPISTTVSSKVFLSAARPERSRRGAKLPLLRSQPNYQLHFSTNPQLPAGTIHPPPNNNPGASEAKNTAVRSLTV